VPTYDYKCQDCGKRFDIRASISAYSEGLEAECPECGSDKTTRGFSAINVLTGSQGSGQSSNSCGFSGFG
jgi:putative FmdB family regulatory protein